MADPKKGGSGRTGGKTGGLGGSDGSQTKKGGSPIGNVERRDPAFGSEKAGGTKPPQTNKKK